MTSRMYNRVDEQQIDGGFVIMEQRNQLALLLLAIFAIQYSAGHFSPLIFTDSDELHYDSDHYIKLKIPNIHKLYENTKEKFGNLIKKGLDLWEHNEHHHDGKLIELEKAYKSPLPSPHGPVYVHGPPVLVPVYQPPPPAPLPYYAPARHSPRKYKAHIPRKHCLEPKSSEERRNERKPIRPVLARPSVRCYDDDYKVRYFT